MLKTAYIPSCPKRIELRLASHTDSVLHSHRQFLRTNGFSRITYAGTIERMIVEHQAFSRQLDSLRKELDTGWVGFWRGIGQWFGFCCPDPISSEVDAAPPTVGYTLEITAWPPKVALLPDHSPRPTSGGFSFVPPRNLHD